MPDDTRFYQSDGLNVEAYDQFTAQQFGVDGRDVAFYLRQARRLAGPVLDLGVGVGRVAWPLAQAGVGVVGLDLSEAMLRRARAKGEQYSPDVRQRTRFVAGDMADFELDETFALVIIAYRSFQSMITPEDQRRCLACIHRHLRPGGRLVVDLFDPRLDLCLPDAEGLGQLDGIRHPVSGNTITVKITRLRTDPVQQIPPGYEHDELGFR